MKGWVPLEVQCPSGCSSCNEAGIGGHLGRAILPGRNSNTADKVN